MGEVGRIKRPQLMVHEDKQTIGNGSSRAYVGTDIPNVCVNCSSGHVCIAQVLDFPKLVCGPVVAVHWGKKNKL